MVHLINFEPGDGKSYKVLYGAPEAAFPYTLLGLGEETDALVTVVLDGPATEDVFLRRWATANHVGALNSPQQLAAMAFLLYLCLLQPQRRDDAGAWEEDVAADWAEDWEDRLITARHRAGDFQTMV